MFSKKLKDIYSVYERRIAPIAFIFGFLWDAYGPTTAFNYCSVVGLIALAVFALMRTKTRPQSI